MSCESETLSPERCEAASFSGKGGVLQAGRESESAVSCELLGQSIVLFLYQPVIQLSSGQKGEETGELS